MLISIFGGILWRLFVARVCITVVDLVRSSFLCPGSVVYACAFTCGCSFTVCSVYGVLISFRVFSVFSHPPLPLLHYLLFMWLMLFIIVVVIIIIVY